LNLRELESVTKNSVKYLRELRESRSGEELYRIVDKHGSDVSRVIDKLSEEYIINSLKELGYDFLFISEESGIIKYKENYEYIALIDPLDGSNNFIAGIPWASISIAIYKPESDFLSSEAGVVAEIFRDLTYSYDIQNPFINGSIVRTTTNNPINLYLIYYDIEQVDIIGRILKGKKGIKVRSLGCASLDIINVCLGNATAYIDIRNRVRNLDVAAAINFCKKLGVNAFDLKGNLLRSSIKRIESIKEIIVSRDPSLVFAYS